MRCHTEFQTWRLQSVVSTYVRTHTKTADNIIIEIIIIFHFFINAITIYDILFSTL